MAVCRAFLNRRQSWMRFDNNNNNKLHISAIGDKVGWDSIIIIIIINYSSMQCCFWKRWWSPTVTRSTRKIHLERLSRASYTQERSLERNQCDPNRKTSFIANLVVTFELILLYVQPTARTWTIRGGWLLKLSQLNYTTTFVCVKRWPVKCSRLA